MDKSEENIQSEAMNNISQELLTNIRKTLSIFEEQITNEGYAEVIGTRSFIIRKDGPVKPKQSPGNYELKINGIEYCFAPMILEQRSNG